MFFSKAKKEALKIHERAVEKYNETYVKMQTEGENLYRIRQKSLELIEEIESLFNSIANSPKDFEAKLENIRKERMKFRKTEEYARQAYDDAVKSGVSMAAGIAGGALSVGGGGIAAGKALLALAGPVGWSIAGVATGASALFLTSKNQATAKEAMDQAKEITMAGACLNETCAKIQTLSEETSKLFYPLVSFNKEMTKLFGADYMALDSDDKAKLGTLVNNALALTALVNRKIENED